jgi:hypothetical protein
MANVLRLVTGAIVTEAAPSGWLALSSGPRKTVSAGADALALSSGQIKRVDAPVSATLDDCCACGEDCGTTNSGCGTCSSCNNSGHAMVVAWTHTGCSDASHHISIHRKIGAGSWVEWFDNLGCDSDNWTCDPFLGCKVCSLVPSGYDGIREAYHNDSGGAGETWDFRVYIEEDGGDTVVDGPCESNSITVSTDTCIA